MKIRFAAALMLTVLAGAHACAAQGQRGPLDLEPDEMRPGLIAVHRSLVEADAAFTRVDAKPAFSLGLASPHPRIPPGPFHVEWTGAIFLRETAPVTFDAYVHGAYTMNEIPHDAPARPGR